MKSEKQIYVRDWYQLRKGKKHSAKGFIWMLRKLLDVEAKKSMDHPHIILSPKIHPYSCLTPVKIKNREERGER